MVPHMLMHLSDGHPCVHPTAESVLQCRLHSGMQSAWIMDVLQLPGLALFECVTLPKPCKDVNPSLLTLHTISGLQCLSKHSPEQAYPSC